MKCVRACARGDVGARNDSEAPEFVLGSAVSVLHFVRWLLSTLYIAVLCKCITVVSLHGL